jgi:hypothetical protein
MLTLVDGLIDSRGAATQGWHGHVLPSSSATGASSKETTTTTTPPGCFQQRRSKPRQPAWPHSSVSSNFGGHQPHSDGNTEPGAGEQLTTQWHTQSQGEPQQHPQIQQQGHRRARRQKRGSTTPIPTDSKVSSNSEQVSKAQGASVEKLATRRGPLELIHILEWVVEQSSTSIPLAPKHPHDQN